jgi:NDP-sugar pyrophosphorylase family protein
MLVTTLHYQVLYDLDRPICFIGHTVYNQMLCEYFGQTRSCQLVRLEDIENNNQEWFDQHQFICAATTISFKRLVAQQLGRRQPHYISIIGTGNALNQVEVGQGTFIQHYNIATFADVKIGNHCTIACHTTLGHDAIIDDYCHIGSYSIVSFTHLQSGCWLGLRSTAIGERTQTVIIQPNCNFLFDSRITRSNDRSGTYYGNKLINKETSLTYAVTINT